MCIFLVAFSVDVGLARRITPKILARTKIFVNVFDSAQYQQVAQRVENPANMRGSCRQLLKKILKIPVCQFLAGQPISRSKKFFQRIKFTFFRCSELRVQGSSFSSRKRQSRRRHVWLLFPLQFSEYLGMVMRRATLVFFNCF